MPTGSSFIEGSILMKSFKVEPDFSKKEYHIGTFHEQTIVNIS